MSHLPWKKAKGPYDNAGPSVKLEFDIEGIAFQVRPTDESGFDTGRRRYFVACVECDCILHDQTTGPGFHVEGHMKEKHGFKGEIGYAK